MLFSRSFKSSQHCLPSPDGTHVATLLGSVISVRLVKSLQVVSVIQLARDLSGPVISFQWSPSSDFLLVAAVDQIQVFQALRGNLQATIRNPVPPATKPTFVCFGPSSWDVYVFSSLGLKLSIFDTRSSKSVELGNPKLVNPSTAPSGFSFRPNTHHLALLTRTSGRDTISIHDPVTKEVQRSWSPDMIDVQGLAWSPDAKWLAVWESAGQGHKVAFYTPDGHLFKTWLGPADTGPECQSYALGAGVKLLQFSADGRYLAVGDSSRHVYMLGMDKISESLRLVHPTTIVPTQTNQIWQEQVNITQAGPAIHTFLRATQTIFPPARPRDQSEPKTGCSLLLFDSSSDLMATCLDEAPATVWIWDSAASELRAALVFHSAVSSAAWHPTCRETLMVRCDGHLYSNMAFVWDPLSEGPRTVDFGQGLVDSQPVGRSIASWLSLDEKHQPCVFFSNTHHYMLASLAQAGQDSTPWKDGAGASGWNDDRSTRQESPLVLVPAQESDDEASDMDDTFVHKR